MPSATAMLDTLLPASAGKPVAAPGVQDAATAGLFSSKLSTILQAAEAIETPAAETPAEPSPLPIGRLSLPALTLAVEVETDEAVAPPASQIDTAGDLTEATVSPAPAALPTPVSDEESVEDAPQTAVDAFATGAASFLAPAPQPAPISETTDAAVDEDAAVSSQPSPSPATPVAAAPSDIIPTQVASRPVEAPTSANVDGTDGDTVHAILQSTAGSEAALTELESEQVEVQAAPERNAAFDRPAPQQDRTETAAAPSAQTPVQSAAPATAPAAPAVVPPAVALAAQASAVQAQSVHTQTDSGQSAEAEQIAAAIKAAAPMAQAEIKASVQTAVRQTASAPSTAAAFAAQLAVAEGTEAEPSTAEAPAVDVAPEAATVAPRTAAPTPMPPQPSPQHQTRPAPVENAVLSAGEQASPTAHVSLADASADRTPSSAPAAADVAAPAAPTTDIAVATFDQQASVETPAQARTSETTATAVQTTAASSLSRATIETTAHLAAQIARKLEGRSTRFDMVLTPEDLGRVDVSLEIGSDGQLAARLAFDNPAAAAELRGRADELRRQLQDAGFQIAQDSLDFTQRDASSGGGFSDRQQQQQRQSLFAGGSRLATQADLPLAPPPGAWTNHSQTRDRVDVRV